MSVYMYFGSSVLISRVGAHGLNAGISRGLVAWCGAFLVCSRVSALAWIAWCGAFWSAAGCRLS